MYSEPRTPNPGLIDTHAHLDSYSQVDEIIGNALSAGVEKMILAAFSLSSSRFNLNMVGKYDNIFASVGIHPNNSDEFSNNAKKELEILAREPKVKAIGETGLDYYREHTTKEQQADSFKYHIELAKELDLPLIVHSREALNDSFKILESEEWPKRGTVFHAFSGTLEQAQRIFSTGGLISVTGVVTFKNAPELQELVKEAPLKMMMVETDSPYLSPVPFRGETNEPANVVKVAEKIAELNGVAFEEVARVTTETAERFFNI